MEAEKAVQEKDEHDLLEEEIETDQYLVFKIRDQEFAIQAMRVQEISAQLNTTPLPLALPYIEGILNLRGSLITIVNIRRKFGFEEKRRDEDTRTIILEYGGFPTGILVDSVEEVIKIRDENVKKLPETATTHILKEYLKGVGMLDNRLIVILEIDSLLSKSDLTAMKEAVEGLAGPKAETQPA